MTRAFRVRQTYDHRLRDAIAATGNADLFRKAVSLRCRLTRLVDLQLPRVPRGRCRDHDRAKLAFLEAVCLRRFAVAESSSSGRWPGRCLWPLLIIKLEVQQTTGGDPIASVPDMRGSLVPDAAGSRESRRRAVPCRSRSVAPFVMMPGAPSGTELPRPA